MLEPDIIVNDLDTIDKDDCLLITTRQRLVTIQEQLAAQELYHMFGPETPIDEHNCDLN